MKKLLSFCLVFFVAGCAVTGGVEDKAPLVLKKTNFSSLPGWQQDDFQGAGTAFLKSCGRILKKEAEQNFSSDPQFGTYAGWQDACRAAKAEGLGSASPAQAKAFFEKYFDPYQALAGSKAQGLFTGYYESTLKGSRTRHGAYQHPLLSRPGDLVMVELGDFRKELKGQRIAGRVIDGKLKPYESRADIMAGKLGEDKAKPLVWLDDPQDAFFVQVQGSGTVHLDDGTQMRVGYDGQNGHPYYAIGRELVKRGEMNKDDVSMDTIRQWLQTHPSQAQDLMNTNPSFVFFREIPATGAESGPQGAEGIALTARRSLAVDHAAVPYGLPVWVDIDYADENGRPLQRLVMAQDTGGAIRGAVRGDFFWGYGETAERMAGPMKAQGRYYFLLPKAR